MKVLVAIKRVVNDNVRIRVRIDQTGVDLSNVKMAINPFDEIALEQAVQLKQAGSASEVLVVSCGPAACQEQLRSAMALGADHAIQVDGGNVDLQPLAVAKLLRAVCLREQPGLVLLGKQAIDDDAHQTGEMLAGLLGWPQATCASQLTLTTEGARVSREVDGGLETVAVRLPAVVTADLRLNQPRFASLPNIMKAKKKPIEILTAQDLGVDVVPRLDTVKVFEPACRPAGRRVSGVPELLVRLRAEARVL